MIPHNLLLAVLLVGQRRPDSGVTAAQFVQRFYNWYVPFAVHSKASASWAVAVRTHPKEFSKLLSKRILVDAAMQERAKGELVGLDFDPFLNSQDPGGKYTVKSAIKSGSGYNVLVATKGTSVTAFVLRHRQSWQFVDFQYSDGTHLLATLHRLAAERTKKRK